GRAALQRAQPDQARGLLRDALSLWRGEPLEGVPASDHTAGMVSRLVEMRVSTIADCIEAELACGNHAAVIGELEQLVGAHPFHEVFRGQLMLALYRAGRQADALRAYADARAALVDE